MNQATSGQGWGEMETTDVRKGWGLWWEEESWLGIWVGSKGMSSFKLI